MAYLSLFLKTRLSTPGVIHNYRTKIKKRRLVQLVKNLKKAYYSIMFQWQNLSQPIIGLSPMADYTDEPFSLICIKFGTQVIFREMVSADAIIHKNAKTLEMIKINKKERPVIQQIFGRDPKIMAEAAQIIYALAKPDGIDINMGCPARKVVKNFHGVALMKEPELAARIIKEVKQSVPIPVSVKTRLGWSKKEEILAFAPILEAAGADLITVHGRTKTQGYEGAADWEMIKKVKKKLSIPLLANGSIFTADDIQKCLEKTQANGVLIARGALGNPWIFQGTPRDELTLDEIKKVVLKHAHLQIEKYGEYGMILFRKHLLFYFKGLPHSKEIKTKMTQVTNLDQLKFILNELS